MVCLHMTVRFRVFVCMLWIHSLLVPRQLIGRLDVSVQNSFGMFTSADTNSLNRGKSQFFLAQYRGVFPASIWSNGVPADTSSVIISRLDFLTLSL